MKKCEQCNVQVNTQNSNCPLCYRELNGENEFGFTEPFKMREKPDNKKSTSLLYKIFFMLSVISVGACLFINIMVQIDPFWSLLVVLGILYCWVLIGHTILSARSIFEKIFLQLVVLIGLLFACEWIAEGSKWMIDYVVPSISLIVILVLFVLSQALKYNKGVLAFFVMTLILTLVSGGFLLFNATNFNILNVITVVWGSIAIIGMLLFNGRVLKTEVSKKFHV